MIVDLFIPCFIDKLFPETGFNLIKILKRLGIDYNYNHNQTCCGQPLFNSGDRKGALGLANKFMADFPNDRPIISLSASCAAYIKKQYPLLSTDPKFIEKHEIIKRNIFEITDFLVNILKIENLNSQFNAKVTYHDSCSALREYGIKEEPRRLLQNVKGLQLIEMEDTDTCCGFGGTFFVKFKSISLAMVEQKVEKALKTGAEYITTTDSSCLINMDSYIRKNNLPIKTLHIVDILASQ